MYISLVRQVCGMYVNVQYDFCFGFQTPFYTILCYFSFFDNLLIHLLYFLIILYVTQIFIIFGHVEEQ